MPKGFTQHRCLFTFSAATCLLLLSSGCSRDPNVRKQKYLESGKRYEKEEKYKEATIQFANALKVDRNFADAHYELGKTYLKMGSVMAGYGELLRTVDLAPGNLQARIDLGNLQVAGGVPEKGAEQAKAVLLSNPNNADAYALMAAVDERKNDPAGALEQIRHALQLDPNRSGFHTSLALIQSQTGQGPANTEDELRKAIALDPTQPVPHLALASLLERRGDRAGAEQQYQAAIKSAPKDLRAREGLTRLYMRASDPGKAEQTLRQAAEDLSDSDAATGMLEEFYLQTGKTGEAEAAYAKLVADHPKSSPLKVVYAKILLNKREVDKATPVIADLVKNNGGNPEVQILNASLQLDSGKVDVAADTMQKAAKDFPQSFEVQLALAKVARVKNNLNLAEISYQAASKLRPTDISAQEGLAEIANLRHDNSQLEQLADVSIKARPNYAPAYLWRGTAEANQNDPGKAEADFQAALKLAPESVPALVELAQLRLQAHKLPEATDLAERALDKDPNSVGALNVVLNADMLANQPAKAQARLQQQIAKTPQNESLYVELAGLQTGVRDLQGALASAQKALSLNPDDERAVQAAAVASTQLGNPDAAITLWQHWIDKHLKDAVALSIVAQVEESKGDKTKAEDYYRQALKLEPDQVVASNNLAYLMVESGQSVDEALQLAQTARRGAPNSPSTADTLAWVYYYKGRFLTARDLLEEAAKITPQNASIQYHLGMIYSKTGDKASATLHLKRAESIEPSSKVGKDAAAALAQIS